MNSVCGVLRADSLSLSTDFDEARYTVDGKKVERQVATCKHKRYTGWARCSSCRQPKLKQICRFLDMRVFYVDPATDVPYILPEAKEGEADAQGANGASTSANAAAAPEDEHEGRRMTRSEREAQGARERERGPPPPFFASETRSKPVEYKSPEMYNAPIDAASRRQVKVSALLALL